MREREFVLFPATSSANGEKKVLQLGREALLD
jgi:hypothetical protein